MLITSPSAPDVARAFLVAEPPYRIVREAIYRYDPAVGVWRSLRPEALKARIQSYDKAFCYAYTTKKGAYSVDIEIEPALRDKIADFVLHHEPLRDDSFFEKAPRGQAVRNGFITITPQGAVLEPHSEDNRARSYLNITYDEKATCPNFDAILYEAMRELPEGEGEEEDLTAAANKSNMLSEFYGAAVFALAPIFQRCMALPGVGNNGKSTITEVLKEILVSDQDATSTPPQMWEKEYYAAHLHDKKLNSVAELPSREIMGSSIFKQVIAGETTQGRYPRGNPFEFKPIAAHVFACNQLPTTGDYSDGYWRRWLVCRFLRRFDLVSESKGARTSEDIKNLIRPEAAGVLNWAIKGAVALLRNNGYTVPKEHHAALAEWRTSTDPVLAFAEACILVDNEKVTPFSEIFAAFSEWAQATNHKGLSTISLGKRLANVVGAKRVRRNNGTHWNLAIKPRVAWTNVTRSYREPPLALLPGETQGERANG